MPPRISALDRGFTLGDGLFETVLWRQGTPCFWREHMDRLAGGCDVMGLEAPDADLALGLARQVIAHQRLEHTRAAVRVTWTAGEGTRGLERAEPIRPCLVVTAAPAPPPPASVRLATSTIRRNDTSPASRLKSLAYLDNVLARREARAAGADDALLLNTRGEVACASVANLFWVEDDRLFTPALTCGVLAGVTRQMVLDRLRGRGVPVEEIAAPRARLNRAAGGALCNSLGGVWPVSALDGRALSRHPLLDEAAACLPEIAGAIA